MTITRNFSKSIAATCKADAKAKKKAIQLLRPKAKQYKEELKELQQQQTALENRIKKRALNLCTRYPDIMVGKITNAGYFLQYHSEQPNSLTIENYLHAIEAIEAELANKYPHKQTTIEGF